MTELTFFDAQLFVLYTGVGHAGLVLASWALAALGFTLRLWPWARLDEGAKKLARRVGALCSVVVGGVLFAGLRVRGTAWDPDAPVLVPVLTLLASTVGLTITAYAAGSAVSALAKRSAGQPALPEPLRLTDPVEAAVQAWEALTAALGRLRAAEQEATARAQAVADGVAAAEYVKAAEAIKQRALLAEELQSTTGAAVLRLACGAPLRRVLERRPDATLSRLNEPKPTVPLQARVDAAVAAVKSFMGEISKARGELELELAGAPGSVAKRLGMDAAARAKPIVASLEQIEATYGRVGHRLEALRLRVSAETDAGAIAGAAMALTGQTPPPPRDVVEVALEMTQAEQSAATALTALGAEPARIAEVVVHASASLARSSSDDDAMADVLRSVRELVR